MEKKVQWLQGRDQLADWFAAAAVEVRKGGLPFGAHLVEVPPNLQTRLSLKVKKHGVSCKIEWRQSSIERCEPSAGPQKDRWLPSSFKQLKKDLARTFRALKQTVNQDLLPDNALIEEFERLSREFVAYAEPPWDQAAREYVGHMENLIRSVREGRGEAVIHEIRDLQTRMVDCHRNYK